MNYWYTVSEAAEHVGTTRTSLKRAASEKRVGIWIRDRLVAITLKQAETLRKTIHDTAGRPKQ